MTIRVVFYQLNCYNIQKRDSYYHEPEIFMKIVRFQKQITKLWSVFILFRLLVTNSGSVQFVQAAPGNIIRVSVASDGD